MHHAPFCRIQQAAYQPTPRSTAARTGLSSRPCAGPYGAPAEHRSLRALVLRVQQQRRVRFRHPQRSSWRNSLPWRRRSCGPSTQCMMAGGSWGTMSRRCTPRPPPASPVQRTLLHRLRGEGVGTWRRPRRERTAWPCPHSCTVRPQRGMAAHAAAAGRQRGPGADTPAGWEMCTTLQPGGQGHLRAPATPTHSGNGGMLRPACGRTCRYERLVVVLGERGADA
jgi:hypothetical protein